MKCPKCGYIEPEKKVFVDLKCERPDSIEYFPDVQGHNDHHIYNSGNKKLDLVCHDMLARDYHLWLGSNKSLNFMHHPSDSKIQRSELQLSQIDTDNCFLNYNERVFLSYSLAINSQSKILSPDHGIHFTQVWQKDCGPAVPFTMTTYNDNAVDKFRYEARAREIPFKGGPYHLLDVGDGVLQNKKTQLIYEFLPAKAGAIKIWINSNDYEYPTHIFNGAWGCKPDISIPNHHQFSVRVGLYGSGQQGQQIFSFDDLLLCNYFPGKE